MWQLSLDRGATFAASNAIEGLELLLLGLEPCFSGLLDMFELVKQEAAALGGKLRRDTGYQCISRSMLEPWS